MAEATKSGSQSSSSSSGGKASAQTKTDRPQEGIETTDQGVAYPTTQAPPPKQETVDKVTYRDPRPLDWPQKADRSVFIGSVHQVDPDDEGKELSGHVYAGKVREDEELELGGRQVESAQVVGGGTQITVIVDGDPINFGSLTSAVSADLLKALETVANS